MGRPRTRARKSTLLILSVLALALILAFSANLDLARPPSLDVQTDGLTSWNPNVACTADLVTIKDVLGPAYPHQSLNGSRYQTNSTAGGVPEYRALSPPCTITNKSGKVISSFVQINGVYLTNYGVKTVDCDTKYTAVNGGGPYPNKQKFCTNAGNILAVGTKGAYLKIEIDRDWLAKGYCGPGVPSCDNATFAKYQSNGSISLDVQGFVFWEGPWHWELHPFAAWKLSGSPPPPPPNAPPSADFSWSPSRGNTTTTFNFTATVSDDHDPPGSIQVRWDWNGDKTWDTSWSTTKTASHKFSPSGNYTVVLEAMDTGGLTSNKSHVVAVAAPAPPAPPPPNAPPTVDFSWTPTKGNTSTVFTFTASVSDDHDPPGSIQVRWDWNGDGTWDTAWSTTKTAQHQFGSPGTYTVVVAAMDTGGLTSTQSHVLTVSAPPPPPPPPGDFTIGANPLSLKIVIGSSGTSAITLKSLNGLSGTANLKASISSSGVIVVWPAASLNPGSVTLPANGTASSTLTVSTSLLTTPATYTVTVTAAVGSISHTVVMTVQVTLPPSNSSLGLVGSQPRMIRDSDL